jgi:sortase A
MSVTITDEAVPMRPPPRGGPRLPAIVRVLSELMVTAGLILLLFAAYEVWGKSIIVDGHQKDLNAQLAQQWGSPTPRPTARPSTTVTAPTTTAPPKLMEPPPPGGSIARLYIPRMGKHWVVVEGIGKEDLAYAPGHYPASALPGQIGNFSVAGHRSPAIFWDLNTVVPKDVIVLETRDSYFVYRVTQNIIVLPTAVEVVAPVPGVPGAKPTEAMLTLTTCNPKWDNNQRLIVHARLERSQPRANGAPVELGQ